MKKIIFALSALMVMTFTSCLKQRDQAGILSDKGSIVIDIPEVSFNNYHGGNQVVSFYQTPAQETFPMFTVRAYSPRDNKPAGDVKVKISANNNNLPAGTVALPTGAFTIPAEITLTKDSAFTVPITITKATLDPANVYAKTFVLTETNSGVISNIGNEITVTFVVKNKYDGAYRVTGSMVDLNLSTITGLYPMDIDLETNSANEVIMFNHVSATGYAHPILSGGAVSVYGGFVPVFVFDANNNVVDVYNGYGQGNNNRWGLLDPTGINKYDPTTKTLRVKYFMTQGSATAVRTKFDETFTFVRVR